MLRIISNGLLNFFCLLTTYSDVLYHSNTWFFILQDEDDEDEENEEGGLSKSGKELKKLLGRASGMNDSDADGDDDDEDVSFCNLLILVSAMLIT